MSITGVNVIVEGIPALLAKFERLGINLEFEMGRALYLEGWKIMGNSKASFVPVKSGVLRASGLVQDPQKDHEGVLIVLGYGGPAVPYAIVQHERLNYQHTVGQAKYLERPALARAAVLDKSVAARLRARLKVHAA